MKKVSFRILTLLFLHRHQVVTRKKIFSDVWGLEFDTGTKRLEVQIHYLRRILKDLDSSIAITTHRGVGLSILCMPINENH
ncbi:helix-turn-helix domain-containing protein [Pseudomonas asiatica]|uniref:helix-turn-helix domain-containing protein n=1 Tax=Pseudomonas asiatica TaxID=2219225 RepID=UPI00383BAE3E